MSKQRILSGIQPTNVLHIGNYLGALKQWVEIQDKYESFFCIVDLHAITVPYQPIKLHEQIFGTVLDYLAAGINPKKSAIFIQSQVPEHVELMWLLSTITPLGELQRMTQYKEKSNQHKKHLNAGLLYYPILQAADILIYKANVVPVGEDQIQHVELTRDIARKFNNTFGLVFPEPRVRTTATKKILSLTDPTRKMSKSDGEQTYIAMSDSPEVIKKKISKAVTATSGGGANQGVKNLFILLKEFSDPHTFNKFETEEKTGTIKYSELKEQLAKDIADHFADFRKKRAELAKKPDEVKKILADGAKQARKIAQATLHEVKEKMGLASPNK
ncbi:MAG: tryptophan--tRNA ligase [Patescibacteria group bacterium]